MKGLLRSGSASAEPRRSASAPGARRRGLSSWARLRVPALAAALAALAAACSTKEPTRSTYFERTVSPILTTSCVRTNTGAGCHVADARGNALGNLDTASFEGVQKRKDLLVDYGPYGQPAFLLKNVDPFQVEVTGYDGVKSTITTDIKHAGGSIFDPTSTGYQTLRRWIQNGATENNTGVPPTNIERLPCTTFIPGRADFDLTVDPPRPDFATFRDRVNGVISGNVDDESLQKLACAASNCHGRLSNSLYFTCGTSPEQLRWNYLAAQEYLAQTAEQSELLRRPLEPSQGGAYHEGGVMFRSPDDEGYRRFDEWARQHGPPPTAGQDPAFTFFAHKVQPVLVKKGCMMLQCHSASMFHDYRLHGGSGGSFSLSATRRNYELSLAQMAVESEDPNASRMIRKNLYRPEVCGVAGCDTPVGIAHRGGPLLEDFGDERASPAACEAGNHDYDNGDLDAIPAYCVLLEWLKRERELHKLAPVSAVVYVRRPVGSLTRAQDFDVYSPGADLRRVGAAITDGALAVTEGTDTSLTAGCGLDPATADIRRPQVSWDGARVAFAARSSASEPLAVYEMNADGSGCAKHPTINATPPSENGLLVHNFDPTYAPPDGGFSRIVFASTRGNLSNAAYDYQGPQRTPADPTKANSNLYTLEPDPAAPAQTRIRQLTFLLNMERQPSFMNDGRIIFTAEKRAPGFYQLSLRRLNLDTGDYHPLYAQRGSIGYPEATQVVELADKDFATIFSSPGAPGVGGGALGVFNRSIGLDFTSPDPADYPEDPGVLDPSQLQAPDPAFFLRSLRFPDPASNARPGQPTSGFYTSPAALPSTSLLVSFEPGGGDYDVYVMAPSTGAKTKLFGAPGSAEVDAVAVYARLPRPIFRSTLDEPNGHALVFDGKPEAEIHVLDFRVLASLLFQNTPTGRVVDPDITTFNVYEDLPPTPEVDAMDKGGSFVATDAFGRVYVRRRLLGSAQVEADGSAKFSIPGGVPIVLELPPTKLSQERGLPRVQREAMSFSPGEYVHQSFRADLFGGLCGQCHGAISGRPIDAALQPDFITQASDTISRFKAPFDMNKPPGARGPITGPPPAP
ncbi:MAG: hypothetical protein KF894_24300 [Labilithrix sp.]|nr:hypothetical protein [Labilithrix sp.]